ncbi:MAG: ABC transporter ATP-binding protein/permease [Clostridia bacterium]|nr:ABC transporter ATP-binding protein/permease [Clostridia bacterium]
MLTLKNITKFYDAGGERVEALRGITLSFRQNEFAAVLGPSGGGKTTLLNILGGLDHYDSGDLIISGKSTKDFRERDWDHYRNHRVGFVFQSYNLIPHQSVLGNVELALTLSGVSRQECKKRAMEALRRVGLSDQAKKRPNQLSGGQMQRVAIARALVNEPEILLADEPTGALDSETGLQVMELLREVAKDRLVIMVTHNPELADTYATRIIRLKDGQVISDSDPYEGDEKAAGAEKPKRLPTMHFGTAIGLSFRNLMTKKGRTFLTSFAGSIGIIGIALILSISTGVRQYIDRVQRDTLSSYPLQIEESQIDMSGMMLSFMSSSQASREEQEEGYIYSGDVMSRMLNAMNATVTHNDLKAFKAWLDSGESGIDSLVSCVQYGYKTPLNLYRETEDGLRQVNPSQVLNESGLLGSDNSMMSFMSSSAFASSRYSNLDVFTELLDNRELLESQYDVLAGKLPENYDEMAVIVSSRGLISDYTLYALGLRDPSEIRALTESTMNGEEISVPRMRFTYDELLSLRFRLLCACDLYEMDGDGIFHSIQDDPAKLAAAVARAPEIKVTAILCPKEDAVSTQTGSSGGIGYLSSLQAYALAHVRESAVVQAQLNNPSKDVLTGLPFPGAEGADVTLDRSLIPEPYRAFVNNMSDEEIMKLVRQYVPDLAFVSSATYDGNLALLGLEDEETPSSISIYPKDFESKEKITALIDAYNERAGDGGQIRYTDYVGLIMSSVTTIINAVSYVLIAFVAISLVVSSIMIGVITYISVLERTKEIGVLRAIGASRRDIGRVFNAETLIVGFVSGLIGILATLVLNVLVNVILHNLTGITATAVLPLPAALVLMGISMILTLIAGLIPSGSARRKDPVTALRTE